MDQTNTNSIQTEFKRYLLDFDIKQSHVDRYAVLVNKGCHGHSLDVGMIPIYDRIGPYTTIHLFHDLMLDLFLTFHCITFIGTLKNLF